MTIQLDRARFATSAAVLAERADDLASRRTDAAKAVEGLLSEWRGEAADRFRELWEEWRGGADEVLAALRGQVDALSGTARDLDAADRSASGAQALIAQRLG